ncbi:MAG: bifunctional UDP-sugar hydrolase/5'-nucleotidase [Candidatus Aminicenantaceae bacterium]
MRSITQACGIVLCVFSCLALLLSCGCVVQARPESVHLVILHVNDTHGHLYPHDFEKQWNVGGAARMATLIKGIRKDNPGRTLVLHAGDVFSRGGPLTVFSGGLVDMLALDAMGIDVMVPGNGEFYTGIDTLMQNAAAVDFPIILANVFFKDTGERLFPPYVIKEIAGLKVGILGLGFFYENHPASWHLSKEHPEVEALKHLPDLLRKTDLVIALTHLGKDVDRQLASRVAGIDVIVGGHSHDYIEKPVKLPGPGGTEVLYAQAGIFGTHVGRLDLHLKEGSDGSYRLVRSEGRLCPVTAEFPDDPEVAVLLEKHAEPLKEVLCISRISLDFPSEGPCPMGDFIAEAMFVNFPADAALFYRDAVHSGIVPGPVTVEDVCRIHRWRSRIVRMSLTGEQLVKVLTGPKVLAHGLSFQRVEGSVSGLRIGDLAVDLQKSYDIVADEALVMNSKPLQGIDFQETGERVDSMLIQHLRALRKIEDQL